MCLRAMSALMYALSFPYSQQLGCFFRRSVGLMDKASASGAGDSRFESWADHVSCDSILRGDIWLRWRFCQGWS